MEVEDVMRNIQVLLTDLQEGRTWEYFKTQSAQQNVVIYN